MADDPFAPLKTWVQEQASMLSWQDLLTQAQEMRSHWQATTGDILEADAPSGAQDGDWSPWHLINHAGAWLENATNALDRSTQDQSTDLGSDQAFYQDSPSFDEASQRVGTQLDRFVAQVEACASGVGVDVIVTHRRLGELNPREYAVFTMWHVNDHEKQIREMRS
jgi:hypothetical protein